MKNAGPQNIRGEGLTPNATTKRRGGGILGPKARRKSKRRQTVEAARGRSSNAAALECLSVLARQWRRAPIPRSGHPRMN